MRAAIYIRVSTEEQARYGFSLRDQREACLRRARERGALEILEFADEGVSGGILDRPGLGAMREALRYQSINLIIVRDPDRLSRKLAHQLLLTEEFEKSRARLEFIDFDWKDTPEGRLFYALRGAIAEYEKEKIRQRLIRGKIQKAKLGGIPVNFNCYGYRYDPDTGRVSIKEEEAQLLKSIFSWFITEEIGVNGIAHRLNTMAAPTRRGKGPWHRQVVGYIVRNPVYTGRWRFKDIPIEVPGIIDEQTWKTAQLKIEQVRQLRAGQTRNSYLLSGLLTCAHCGGRMNGTCVNWWGKKKRLYTCRKKPGRGGAGCCPATHIPADSVEDIIWRVAASWLGDRHLLARELEEDMKNSRGVHYLEKELTRLQKKRQEAEYGMDQLINLLASDININMDRFKTKFIELKYRIEKIMVQEQDILSSLGEARTDDGNNFDTYLDMAGAAIKNINQLTFTDKRNLVRNLLSGVTVSVGNATGGPGNKTICLALAAKISEKREL